jgi:hypothetical protein
MGPRINSLESQAVPDGVTKIDLQGIIVRDPRGLPLVDRRVSAKRGEGVPLKSGVLEVIELRSKADLIRVF